MKSNQWYEDNKENILTVYYDGAKIEDLCHKLSCSRSMIYKKLNDWGVNRRIALKPEQRHNAIYNIDYEYFDKINCEHKAYWVGFLLADGFVNEKEISVGLQAADIETIENFRNDLKAEHPIKYNKRGYPILTICCKHMSSTLIGYGFHNRKSWSIDMNKMLRCIPSEYEHHFIRGMFDGDGCVKYYKYSYQKVAFYHFGYTGLKNVCEYVCSKLNIDSITRERDTDTFTAKTKNPSKIIDIYNYMYKDATICMKRKCDTFLEIIEIEKERDAVYNSNNQKSNLNRDRQGRITYNGETRNLKEWSEVRNINYSTLCGRINSYNWSIGRALEYE